MSYAAGTSVPVRKSRMEIEDMLTRHRASRTFTIQEEGLAIVGFVVDNRAVQFELALPRRDEFSGNKRGLTSEARWEQACREKWRALVLALKSKFVSIETGIETTEQAFLAHIVLPNKQTVHRWFKAQLEESYKNNGMPALMAGSSSGPSP